LDLLLGIAAPLNPAFTKEEFIFYLKDLNAKRVLTLQEHSSNLVVKEAAFDLHIPVWELSIDWTPTSNRSFSVKLTTHPKFETEHSNLNSESKLHVSRYEKTIFWNLFQIC
jgi:hypothetical protein